MKTIAAPFEPQDLSPDFFAVTDRIYADRPHWLGEDQDMTHNSFSPQNVWHQNGKMWLGVDGRDLRLVGMVHPAQTVDDEAVGFFGFWETVDDLSLNQKLFGSLESWMSSLGVKRMIGPINFNTFGSYRVRLQEYCDKPCFIGEPYNPDYYERILRGLGFKIHSKYSSQFAPLSIPEVAKVQDAASSSRSALAGKGFYFEKLTEELWNDRLGRLYELVGEIFGENLGYQSISMPLFKASFGQAYFRSMCKICSTMAFDSSGDVAGVLLAFPDYSPLATGELINARGKLKFDFQRDFSSLKDPLLIIKTIGVRPGYRRQGLLRNLMQEAFVRADGAYAEVCGALTNRDNPSTRGGELIATYKREYALFEKRL